MLLKIPPHRRPVLAPVHAPNARRAVAPVAEVHPREVDLERRVRVAEDHLAHVAQAVLDVVRGLGRAVRREADAERVQAVHLVHHRDEERARAAAPVGAGDGHGDVDEAVGRELGAPLVVGVYGEVGLS